MSDGDLDCERLVSGCNSVNFDEINPIRSHIHQRHELGIRMKLKHTVWKMGYLPSGVMQALFKVQVGGVKCCCFFSDYGPNPRVDTWQG